MAKKRVYVETSVISYLTARLSTKPIIRLHQTMTADWWEQRDRWDCFLSSIVMMEILRGDPKAAMRREEKARFLVELPGSPDADALGDLLVNRKLVPESQKVDAYHLALAAFHRADYLLTWNQSHLDNLELRFRIEELIKGWGLTPAKVITPERLLEESL